MVRERLMRRRRLMMMRRLRPGVAIARLASRGRRLGGTGARLHAPARPGRWASLFPVAAPLVVAASHSVLPLPSPSSLDMVACSQGDGQGDRARARRRRFGLVRELGQRQRVQRAAGLGLPLPRGLEIEVADGGGLCVAGVAGKAGLPPRLRLRLVVRDALLL
jgi:hypothetical protein